jgi:hypothetical protein
MLKLVWLIMAVSGAPLGAYVFPDHLDTAACTEKVNTTTFTPDEQKLGDYISDKLGQNIEVTPACLTDDEVQDMLAKLKLQGAHPAATDGASL